MPKRAAGLSALKVKTAGPGRYADGDGLYLFVRSPEAAFWVYRFRVAGAGKTREAGAGRARGPNAVTLAEARARASELRKLVKAGTDPLVKREADAIAAKAAVAEAAARAITFRTVAGFYLAAHDAGWRNDKHRWQWRHTLETHVFPVMGDVPVADVAVGHVMKAVEPIWREKTETASRVRGRIESVLDYAAARGWRTGDNPARWRGHLSELLPAKAKIAPVEHHAAMPWREVGAFMVDLRTQGGIAARALEFVILTAARTSETTGARWNEFDLSAGVWTIPGNRMKAGAPHRVPLSPPGLAILDAMAKLRATTAADGIVFPGARPDSGLSIMSMTAVLRRMKRDGLTVHGFRSTFRDWCGEMTNVPREIAEAALAHTLKDKTESAYRRGDALEKRRRLMIDWADFCGRPAAEGATVTPIRAA